MTIEIAFPVMVIRPCSHDENDLDCFDHADFHESDPDDLVGRNDMFVFDSAGRTFKTVACEATPIPLPKPSFWQRCLPGFFGPWPRLHLAYRFETTPQLSLAEIKQRICAALDDDPNNYWSESQAHSSYDFTDVEDALDPLKADVHSSTNLTQIMELLFPETVGPKAKRRRGS